MSRSVSARFPRRVLYGHGINRRALRFVATCRREAISDLQGGPFLPSYVQYSFFLVTTNSLTRAYNILPKKKLHRSLQVVSAAFCGLFDIGQYGT